MLGQQNEGEFQITLRCTSQRMGNLSSEMANH